MPTCVYLRGAPGTGKRTAADILERDLGWPVLWVHHFDAVYKAIGEYKVPRLTDELMAATAKHLMAAKRDFIIVRPSRSVKSVEAAAVKARDYEYRFLPVTLIARYQTLCLRVRRRWHESPFRITTREALDEYLHDRPGENYDGETVINTEELTPEQVAGRIKELL